MSFENSALKEWIYRNNCYIKYGDKRPYTHLLLNGGKYHVPKNKTKEFLKVYAKDIKDGKVKHYICETKTETFKLLADLDFFNDSILDDNEMLKYVKEIQNVVSKCFHENEISKLIICTTDSKSVFIDGAEYIKTGIHMIWNNIIVTRETCLMLRLVILKELEKTFGKRLPHNTWADVLDRCVYEQNGLRMIGSRKTSKCKDCNNKQDERANCETCYGTGKYDEGRVYLPKYVLNHKGELDNDYLESLNNDITKMIEETSIVVYDDSIPESVFQLPQDIKISYRELEKEKTKRRTNRNKRLPPGKEEQEGLREHSERVRIDITDKRFVKLRVFAKKYLPECYSRTKIIDLFSCANGDYYVARTDSHFCQNINKEHNSNTIYFYIDSHHLYQKCFCRCNTTHNRIDGLCKDYRSRGIPLGVIVRETLFPNMCDTPKSVKSADTVRFEPIEYDCTDEEHMKKLHDDISFLNTLKFMINENSKKPPNDNKSVPWLQLQQNNLIKQSTKQNTKQNKGKRNKNVIDIQETESGIPIFQYTTSDSEDYSD